jgi:hypothetical protein
MPPERARGPKPFKPPRPRESTGSTAASASKPKPKPKVKPAKKGGQSTSRARESVSSDPELSDTPPPPRASKSKAGPSGSSRSQDAADSTAEDENSRANIPPALLTRLLSEFMSDGMRISQGADRAVGLYMETFVREAVVRAKYEREESDAAGRGVGLADGFLEVEDLEKLAPQLVLDF